jgi:hypothetical protein
MPRYTADPFPQPGPNFVLETAIRDFKRSVEITRDVRFQANLRLSARQRLSAYVVSTLSLFVIALSLIPNILDLKPFQSQILLGCTERWSRFPEQHGGLAKVDSGFDYAANFSSFTCVA